MIKSHLDTAQSILYISPESALEQADFRKLADKVDPYIEASGGLRGIIIEAPAFPGWENFGALVAHFRFVRDHHRHIEKIALVTNSAIGNVAEHFASHFVSAQIKQFSASEMMAAEQWVTMRTWTHPRRAFMKRYAVIISLMLVSSLVLAAAYNQLSGTYRIGGKTLYDPPENELQNTHLYIQLTGESAKDLYQTMQAKPKPDDCGDEGNLTKKIGNMQCTRSADNKTYQCWFGVDVKNQKITNGVVCW
jgi:hypothetical protein